MTQPGAGGPPALPLNINTQLVDGPDGKPARVGLQFGMGMTAYMVQADVEQVPGLARLLHTVLMDAYDQAKRAQVGLVIPQPGDVGRINGQQH